MLKAVLDSRQPTILVVLPDTLCHDLLDAAIDGQRARDANYRVLHFTSTAQALQHDLRNEHVVALFIGTPELEHDIAALQSMCNHLLSTVVVLPDGRAEPPLCEPTRRDAYPLLRHPLGAWETYSTFLARCRPHVSLLTYRLRVVQTLAQNLEFLAAVHAPAELTRVSRVMLTQIATLFRVDVVLMEDFLSETPRTGASVAISDDASFLDNISEAALAAHMRRQRRDKRGADLLLSDLFPATKSAGDEGGIDITPFRGVFHERRPFWFSLASLLQDTVGCYLGVAPVGAVPHEMPAILAVFADFFHAWAQSYETTFLAELSRRASEAAPNDQRLQQESIHQMVCGIAHEVNTPLGVINTAAACISNILAMDEWKALAQKTSSEDLSNDIVDATRMIRAHSSRLGELVNKFKTISVMQLVETLESVELDKLIDHAISSYRTSSPNSHLAVNAVYDLDPSCETWIGYPKQMSTVVGNILDNIAKHAYGSKGGLVEVHLRGRRVKGEVVYSLTFTDFGVGISAENLPKIFDAFFTTVRASPGSGLGLAVVHNIVTHSFGGEISCLSEPDRGTALRLNFRSLTGGAPARARPLG